MKEGVAAGASMAVANIAGGAEPEAIVAAIDRMYDENGAETPGNDLVGCVFRHLELVNCFRHG